MSKATKVFLILFVSVFTAGVAANIICEIFKTRLQKYYSVGYSWQRLSGWLLPSFSLQKLLKLKLFQQNFRLLG